MKKILTVLMACILLTGCLTQNGDVKKPSSTPQPTQSTPPPQSTGPQPTTPPSTPSSQLPVMDPSLYQFAPYTLLEVSITCSVPGYSFDPENLGDIPLTPDQKRVLLSQGFVVVPSGYQQFYNMYQDCKKRNIPICVTSDAVLHTYHILYDYTLRILESEHFARDILRLTQTMAETQHDYYIQTGDELALKNVAYFCVAGRLLDASFPTPPDAETLVTRELELIEAHRGFDYSPIFEYREDYSQYVPRGHYTRSEELEKYFKAMMWYGRMMFRLKSPEETKQALYLVKGIQDTDSFALWDTVYSPTVFFVGKSDDLSIIEYGALITTVYGDSYTLSDLQDVEKLATFIDLVKELRDPRITSTWVRDYQDVEEETKGFRFMGQRFIPDSYMFQQLVYDKVGTASSPRLFPKGLDIMAVLGSERALSHLEPEKQYQNYESQMEILRSEFSQVDVLTWTQNLYWSWLYSLLPLLEEKGECYPAFMQSDAWTDKELNTALGSWTELRHDTILYAKQSYTLEATGIPSEPRMTRGYVEPNAEVYARLASLARMMREGLENRDLLLPEYRGKLQTLETLLLNLTTISEKELSGEDLSEDEYRIIWNFGDTLETLVTFETAVETETDEKVAVVADVHTDVNTGQVLEEGVGNVFYLFAVVLTEGHIVIVQGGVFSYYEFLQPLRNRLTDEQWQSMEKPPLPPWTSSFIIE
ncbi:MAG: DUF3160 domain-containing protein [Theionarchaea archaeon]|nr:DUF3160 domain-containing protein [Theionarchaea archaeon]